MTIRSLQEALKEALDDDNKVSKYEAQVLREIIMADGRVSQIERDFLNAALQSNRFDDEAFKMLSDVLLRVDLT